MTDRSPSRFPIVSLDELPDDLRERIAPVAERTGFLPNVFVGMSHRPDELLLFEADEPDHWLPYHGWLTRQGRATAKWRERWADWWIHKSLMLAKLPAVFLNRATPRLEKWPHEDAGVYGVAG